MKILYLQQIEGNPTLRGFTNESMSIIDIDNLEKKYNNNHKFPKAFREFLFLAGEFNNFSFDLIEGIEELQQYAKEELNSVKLEVERPFFAFSVYDSQYSIIFLDEDKEDPDVYILDPFGAFEENLPLIKQNNFIFSELVNESIRRVKNNIPF